MGAASAPASIGFAVSAAGAAAASHDTVAGTYRSDGKGCPAGQGRRVRLPGNDVSLRILDPFRVIFSFIHIQRAADQLQIRKAEKEDRLPGGNRQNSSVL